MLAELGAANAAFGIIKAAINNSGEIVKAGEALFKYFDCKAEIQKKSNKKGNRPDLEEFLALEQLKQQEQQLREEMIYAGRPGLWEDWLRFQAEAARKREAQRKALLLKKLARKQLAIQVIWYAFISVAVTAIAAISTWIAVKINGR